MKIIDAFWEKRNIGVDTIEIIIEEKDTIDDIEETLRKIDSQYIVVKVPAGKIDAMFLLNKLGYNFIECIIRVTHDLENIELKGIPKRLSDNVSYSLMNEKDYSVLFDEINKGMFTTDRIYLDPSFTIEQASKRYIGWIKDELSKGAEAFKLVYKEKHVGFFMLKEIEKDTYYPFLAGIYNDYRNTGLGYIFNYKPLCEVVKKGGKMVSTYISTNNSNTVRMHSILGFQFNETNYVYIYHNKKGENY
ncbi:hypothetical protein [Clostridium sp. SM-530-WT-3G]|uniref:hypothetical protein n=1 Tax=Clostridium sp. SM-530-WT-3G TaxID=2725303 RepID=UPI00145E7DEA|nr:hypothetical protein [Clostridium sp. SM-530-WT-3G]NME82785.1 hypothetical protein [Clostridium sp. SM-530-WT-3G]